MPKRRERTTARGRAGSSRKARRRIRRIRRIAALVVFAAAVGVYAYDYFGPLETVRGTVASTRTYPHGGRGGPVHTHTKAVVEYEGARHTLRQADGLTRGQAVSVDVRRGRLSGRLRFVAFRRAVVPGGGTQPSSIRPEPWAYDPVRGRHWNPIHGHWHDGPPPPPGQR